ncbi:hypothetical protein [Delftia tsuruhatensis]|uniref:hypothetical protein n=1 Tax=Delftia tsuruhatensis TaxID=180282 RepID=UPI002260BD01|nr:hypothetical protein [Delftia tsuruhatensis]MCX7509445.1 hypothetical protein [Delftia tsuruhatensis]
MYADPADIRKHRFNLSANAEQRALFLEEAARARKQVSPLILELALEALQWRRHAGNSDLSDQKMRRADA